MNMTTESTEKVNIHSREVQQIYVSDLECITLDVSRVKPGQKYIVIDDHIFEADGTDSEVIFEDGKGRTETRLKFKKTNLRLYKGGQPVEAI